MQSFFVSAKTADIIIYYNKVLVIIFLLLTVYLALSLGLVVEFPSHRMQFIEWKIKRDAYHRRKHESRITYLPVLKKLVLKLTKLGACSSEFDSSNPSSTLKASFQFIGPIVITSGK